MGSTRLLVGALAFSALVSVGLMEWIGRSAAGKVTKPARLRKVQLPDNVELGAGEFLIASRKMRDPNFSESVILLTQYDDEGTMGLVINRKTDVPMSRILDTWKESKGRTEPVFVGGPVQRNGILALIRSRPKLDQAARIFADVHLSVEKPLLQKHLAAGAGPDKFRIYLGYAGWSPEQLENEIELGAWVVMPADANSVFDADPETLWTRLTKRSETQIAKVALRSPGMGSLGLSLFTEQ
jgi:putative transcriptional regulator